MTRISQNFLPRFEQSAEPEGHFIVNAAGLDQNCYMYICIYVCSLIPHLSYSPVRKSRECKDVVARSAAAKFPAWARGAAAPTGGTLTQSRDFFLQGSYKRNSNVLIRRIYY